MHFVLVRNFNSLTVTELIGSFYSWVDAMSLFEMSDDDFAMIISADDEYTARMRFDHHLFNFALNEIEAAKGE